MPNPLPIAYLCIFLHDPLPPHVATIPCFAMPIQECDAYADRYEFDRHAWWCSSELPARMPEGKE